MSLDLARLKFNSVMFFQNSMVQNSMVQNIMVQYTKITANIDLLLQRHF